MKRFAFSLAVLLLAISTAWADLPPLPPPPPPPPPTEVAADVASSVAVIAGVVAVVLGGLWLARRAGLRLEPQG